MNVLGIAVVHCLLKCAFAVVSFRLPAEAVVVLPEPDPSVGLLERPKTNKIRKYEAEKVDSHVPRGPRPALLSSAKDTALRTALVSTETCEFRISVQALSPHSTNSASTTQPLSQGEPTSGNCLRNNFPVTSRTICLLCAGICRDSRLPQ